MPSVRSSNTWSGSIPTLRWQVRGSGVQAQGSVMYRPPSLGQQRSTGRLASDGRSVSTTSWHGPSVRRRGPAFTRSKSVPSFRSRSANVPGSFTSRSLPTRSPSSSRWPTPSAIASRSAAPNVLTSTGMSKPSTRSKRRATFPSAGPFETRSVISVISRSRETGTATRRRRPVCSRRATSSRRSRNALTPGYRSLAVEDGDEPARHDGEGEAPDDADADAPPAHQRPLPSDDPLDTEEGPRRHVGHQRRQRGARVGERDHERHADHRAAGREHARDGRHEDRAKPARAAEVSRDHLLRNQHLHEAGEHQRRHQARQDEPEHREAVLRADEREPRILQIRDRREDERQHDEDDRGGIDEWAHRGSFRALGRHTLWHSGVLSSAPRAASCGA